MDRIILKMGRERSLLRRHPWIFSGAIERIEGEPQSGDTLAVHSHDGAFLALAGYSPDSQIRARIWSFTDEEIDTAFFARRIEAALKCRASRIASKLGAARVVNAESDLLPGLIVDYYDGFFICQFLTAGIERWRDTIVAALSASPTCRGVFERSDSDARVKEGLEKRIGPLAGDEPPEEIVIEENGVRFNVDVRTGHKTGFYLDQRENRAGVMRYAKDKRVLNCFSYTGGFGLSAMRAGAKHITAIEASADAIELYQKNIALNGFENAEHEEICGDVFRVMREFRDVGRKFDLIVLDPPKFAESKSNIERAARGYKDINLLAFRLLNPNGILFTFSCSGLLETDLFQKIVAGAALDAKADVQIIERMTQADDHPVLLSFPEGDYLKGLVCRVI
jgi:23S rRNA (cytosine1962-C5)-methyltransferase